MTDDRLRRSILSLTLLLLIAHGAWAQKITDVARKRAILKTLDSMYYSLPKLGAPGFTAEARSRFFDTVETKLREKGAPASVIKAVQGVKISLKVRRDGDYTVMLAQLPPSGYDAVDAKLRDATGLFVSTVNEALMFWKLFVWGMPFSGSPDSYTITERKDGSMVVEIQGARNFFDKEKVLTRMVTVIDGVEAIATPTFKHTEHGLLLDHCTHDFGKKASVSIDYIFQRMGGVELVTGLKGEVRHIVNPDVPDDAESQKFDIFFTDIKPTK